MRVAAALMITSVVVLAVVATAGARTWYIRPDGSGDAPTIQAGVDSAATGDVVLLAAGTYTGVGNKDIDFLGKAITVTSESGRKVTIIDCERLGRGFIFQSGEGSSSVLSGVTIRNGFNSDGGGGICCSGSSPTISGNTISGGARIPVYDLGGGGGAIGCWGASPNISNNTISGDAIHGGGIYCMGSSPTISGNIISGSAMTYGGTGGGIYCGGASSPTISGNIISKGTAGYGGGIYCLDSSPTVSGNIITENLAGPGGGICCYRSSPTISGNTITGNYGNSGSGICSMEGSTPTISNTIIAFGMSGPGISCLYEPSSAALTCCDIYGNEGGDWVGCIADQYGANGNFSADPKFCHRWENDWCIDYSSPCAPGNHPYGYDCGSIGARGVGCDRPTAIQPTTWGRIKGIFR